MNQPPVFIVGCDRSGTTLLRLMLTAHPDLAIPPESVFARRLFSAWGGLTLENADHVEAILAALFEEEKFQEWQLDRAGCQAFLLNRLPMDYAAFVAGVYRCYADQFQPGATRWGDKNPSYATWIANLWELFPQAYMIHILRDGRAVWASFRSANHRAGRAIWPEAAGAAARFWVNRIETIRRHRNSPRYFEIVYEQLVLYPERELKRLCDFIALTFDDRMLAFAENTRQKGLVPAHRLAWHASSLRPLLPEKIDSWRQELSKRQVAQFELYAGATLARLNYPLAASRVGGIGWVNRLLQWADRLRGGRSG